MLDLNSCCLSCCWEHPGGSVLVILRQLLAGKILGQEAGSDCFPLKILQGGIQGCLGRRDLLSKINASSSSVFLEYLQASGSLTSLRIEDSREVTGGEVKSANGFVAARDPAEPREAAQKHHRFQRNQKSKHLPAFSFDLKIHRNRSAS